MNKFNPEMLILARESRGITQGELANKVGVYQGTVSKLENGLLPLSDDILKRIAETLGYPVHLFYQEDKVFGFNSTVFFHRKRAALSDSTLRKLHAQVNLERIRIARLLLKTAIEVNSFCHIDAAQYGGKPETVAQILRATWQLPAGPIRNMTQAIEDAGGVVVKFDFNTNQADAISEWIAGFPPLFFVNSDSAITWDRIRMTLAHEVGHVIMHKFPHPEMEDQANRFASEFLMPSSEIKSSLRNLSFPKLAELKSYWKVSMAALVRRAYELGTITESQYKYLMIKLSNAGYRVREPISTDVPPESTTLLNDMIQAHLRQLGYSPSQLADYVLMLEQEFKRRYFERGLRLVG
jgi:Zn-dependent peptidase ImmA (M78 family)/transcriptional regulator with XRE-family HTH domain